MPCGGGAAAGSWRLAGLAAVTLLALVAPARAEARAISVRWAPSPAAAPSCPSESEVRQRVRAVAGPDVALDADADVTTDEDGFRVVLHVKVGDAVGEQVLRAATCAAAAESVAVVLAMSGTSARAAPPPPPPPSPPPMPAAPPSPAVVLPSPAPPPTPRVTKPARPPAATPVDPAPGASPPRPPWIRLSGEGSLDLGTLPVATPGGTLRATLTPPRAPRLEVGLAGSTWGDQKASLPNGQGFAFTLATVDAFGCYGWLHGRRLELAPCVLVEGGRISASAFNAGTSGAVTAYWVSLGGGAHARWELTTWLALAVEFVALVPIPAQQFTIQGPGGGTIQASPVAGRASFGPEVRF